MIRSLTPPIPAKEIKFSLCKTCGKPIRYNGKYWEHVTFSPRHAAIPSPAK